jgi:hypothetical protein
MARSREATGRAEAPCSCDVACLPSSRTERHFVDVLPRLVAAVQLAVRCDPT